MHMWTYRTHERSKSSKKIHFFGNAFSTRVWYGVYIYIRKIFSQIKSFQAIASAPNLHCKPKHVLIKSYKFSKVRRLKLVLCIYEKVKSFAQPRQKINLPFLILI